MIYIIVHALAPVFIIMLLGFWAGKAGMVNNRDVSLLNIFVMDFALPLRCSVPPFRHPGRVLWLSRR